MFIFLYGIDTYRSRQKLKEIIDRYKKIREKGLNLTYFDASKLSFQDFINQSQQTSIFKEKKLIILINLFSNNELKKIFLEKEKKDKFLTKLADSEDIILIFEEQGVLKKEPLFIFFKKFAKCQEFKLLEGQNLKIWIKKEFINEQVEISQGALEQLAEFVGNDLWRLSNEIKKLAAYKKNPASAKSLAGKQKIEAEDVEHLVRTKVEIDIFKTIEAIAIKDKKQALGLLHKHLERGDEPLYLLSMINFQFRNLLIIKDLIEKNYPYYVLTKETQLHPYVIKKAYFQSQKFTFEELKKIYQKIFQIDLKIKTGQIDARLALDLFIAEI